MSRAYDVLAHERLCAAMDCDKVGTVGRGLCRKHYERWYQRFRHPDSKPKRPCHCGVMVEGRSRYCSKECKLAQRRADYAAHPETTRASQARWNERNKGWGHTYRSKKLATFIEPVMSMTVFERDGWRCQLCGRRIMRDVAYLHSMAPVLDHIVPLSVGGTHEYRNVQAAHRACNNRKGNRVFGTGEQLRLIG